MPSLGQNIPNGLEFHYWCPLGDHETQGKDWLNLMQVQIRKWKVIIGIKNIYLPKYFVKAKHSVDQLKFQIIHYSFSSLWDVRVTGKWY